MNNEMMKQIQSMMVYTLPSDILRKTTKKHSRWINDVIRLVWQEEVIYTKQDGHSCKRPKAYVDRSISLSSYIYYIAIMLHIPSTPGFPMLKGRRSPWARTAGDAARVMLRYSAGRWNELAMLW